MSSIKTAVNSSARKMMAVVLAAVMALSISLISAHATSNEEYCYNFFTSNMGLNRAGASGLLANIEEESDFNPTACGDSGKSYGLCQWNSARKSALVSYCQSNGLDYESLYGQLCFIKYELTSNYPEVGNYLKSVDDSEDGAYDAGYYFCYNYERPSNKDSKSKARGTSAIEYYNKYAGTVSQSVSGNTSDNSASAASYTTGTYLVNTSGSNLNMRSGAGTGYKILAKVPDQTTLDVTEVSGSWGKAQYGDVTGWISLNYCTKQETQSSSLVSALSSYLPKIGA